MVLHLVARWICERVLITVSIHVTIRCNQSGKSDNAL